MAKTLLSLMLVLTQLLSWSTSSLYLCIDSHGAICLDGGPDSCDCCQQDCHDDHEGLHVECSHHDCSEKHDHGLPSPCDSEAPEGWMLADAGCDCSHIQIVSQQLPTTVHAAASIDSAQQELVAPLADVLPKIPSAVSQIDSSGGPFRAASSFALIERASVCLRC